MGVLGDVIQVARRNGKHWTLVLVPHTGNGRVVRFCCPQWVGYALAAGAAILVIVAGILINSYRVAQAEMAALQQLKTVNEEQAERIRQLQEKAAALDAQAQQVKALEEQVRQMVGLESRPGGMGGGQPAPPVTPRVADRSEDLPGADQWRLALGELDAVLANAQEGLQAGTEQLDRLKQEVEAKLRRQAAYPDAWPVRGRVTSPFGWRTNPFTGRGQEFHDGLDIDARLGDPVRAAGGGRVIFAGWREGYGRMVTIDHGYGYRTSYAHNSQLLVKTGQTVQKGEVIARVGSSGRSTGSHMHFMVEKGGRLINPLEVLR